MVLRVEKIGEVMGVILTPETMAALELQEGAVVELVPAEKREAAEHRYISVEEGLAAYRRTEPRHRNTYRELAK